MGFRTRYGAHEPLAGLPSKALYLRAFLLFILEAATVPKNQNSPPEALADGPGPSRPRNSRSLVAFDAGVRYHTCRAGSAKISTRAAKFRNA
jgi:hypothetical protein